MTLRNWTITNKPIFSGTESISGTPVVQDLIGTRQNSDIGYGGAILLDVAESMLLDWCNTRAAILLAFRPSAVNAVGQPGITLRRYLRR